MDNLLRLEDIAERLGISYQHARMLVLYDEVIPHFKVGSRGIRVKEEDLAAYIAKEQTRKEEAKSGSKDNTARRPSQRGELYSGSGVLQGTIRRDKPFGTQ